MKTKWNAKKYTDDFTFVARYGSELVELIENKNGHLLDLGCGNGELTNYLKSLGYKVIGLDESVELLEIAKNQFPSIDFKLSDATNFNLKEPVDIVFSNAVFHWIDKAKQKNLLNCIYNALKPGGELIFECGGVGNNAIIHNTLKTVFTEVGYDYEIPFYFPSIGEYSALLEDLGFQVTFAILFDRETKLKGENGLYDWIKMFIREPLIQIKEKNERENIVKESVQRMKNQLFKGGHWYADYVRLRMRAIRL